MRLSSPQPQPSPISIKIADLGNACWTSKHFTMDIQTRQYRSPEVILGAKYDTSTDIWSLGCIIFELVTGDFMFDPKSGNRYTKGKIFRLITDDDHITQIIELLGHFPKPMTQTGKFAQEIFNRKGEVRHIHKLRFWPLANVLYEKYRFGKKESKDLADFITKMCVISPGKRKTAGDLLLEEWIGVNTEMK